MRQRKALTKEVLERYRKSPKKEKSKILNEFVLNTKYNRSYARRLFISKNTKLKIKHGVLKRKSYSRRERIYDNKFFFAIRKIWLAADQICGQRLKPFIPELTKILEEKKELKINKTIRQKLLKVGSATIDRILKYERKKYELKKGRSTTKPGTLLKHSIPIRTFEDWDDKRVGFEEADLVAFCGDTVRGEYVNGLNLVDVATGWVSLEAFIGKAQIRVHTALTKIKKRLPFSLLGFDSDNGAEFINGLIKRYCDLNKITFTRIRPYKKNDNCFVEQKNYTVLRRFVGYRRYETEEQLKIIQEMLKLVELYVNFFQPSMKLIEKHRKGAKVKKKYDKAKTPYQRLKESGILTPEKEKELDKIYRSLNPMGLRKQILKLQIKLSRT